MSRTVRDDDLSEHSRLLMSAVAELTDSCILSMNDQELIFATRVSQVSFHCAADLDRLPELDHRERERMAFQVRYVSRICLTGRSGKFTDAFL